MDSLWVPERKPPQLKNSVADTIIDRIFARGLTRFYQETVPVFQLRQTVLKDLVETVTIENLKDERPLIVLQTSAVVTALAYLENGYEPVDEDALALRDIAAELEGIPDAYIASFCDDPELQRLVGTLVDTPEFQDGAQLYDYQKILDLGAGCVRYYTQFAIAS